MNHRASNVRYELQINRTLTERVCCLYSQLWSPTAAYMSALLVDRSTDTAYNSSICKYLTAKLLIQVVVRLIANVLQVTDKAWRDVNVCCNELKNIQLLNTKK